MIRFPLSVSRSSKWPTKSSDLFRGASDCTLAPKAVAAATVSELMEYANDIVRRFFAILTCLAWLVRSVVPSFTHAPTVFETIQDHLEMVEDHGHSHGFEEDLYWAIHGHSHDVADHDHNQAFLSPGRSAEPSSEFSEPWLRIASTSGPTRQFRIDRPPRV